MPRFLPSGLFKRLIKLKRTFQFEWNGLPRCRGFSYQGCSNVSIRLNGNGFFNLNRMVSHGAEFFSIRAVDTVQIDPIETAFAKLILMTCWRQVKVRTLKMKTIVTSYAWYNDKRSFISIPCLWMGLSTEIYKISSNCHGRLWNIEYI